MAISPDLLERLEALDSEYFELRGKSQDDDLSDMAFFRQSYCSRALATIQEIGNHSPLNELIAQLVRYPKSPKYALELSHAVALAKDHVNSKLERTRSQLEAEQFDVMQVCLNGHLVNGRTRDLPERNENFCVQCGLKTITICSKCSLPIRGTNRTNSPRGYVPPVPRYCRRCGNPYPWQLAAVDELRHLFEDSEASDLATLTTDLVSETPRSARAIQRLKEWYANVGEGLHATANDILKSVATEAAKKAIGL